VLVNVAGERPQRRKDAAIVLVLGLELYAVATRDLERELERVDRIESESFAEECIVGTDVARRRALEIQCRDDELGDLSLGGGLGVGHAARRTGRCLRTARDCIIRRHRIRSRRLEETSRVNADPHLAAVACDVVVVGGGPAGSTVATLLADRGWSVALIERERHPRFHIGESLLPMNLPILERLGVLDDVRRIGVLKRGADFPATNERGYNVFRFDRALNSSPPHAFQVRRDQFDELLFRHAVGSGVQGFEGTTVEDVELGSDGVRVTARQADGVRLTFSGRYLVDATGRNTLLGNRLGLRRRHERHQSAALFAHFTDVERRPDEDAGNISIVTFEHGWIWIIPLPGDVTSVGAVCWPQYLKQRKGPPIDFLRAALDSVVSVRERMRHARVLGNVHATGNYSYHCTRIAGPRWVMVGDACAFVDPIFSTGVYLAMASAEKGAEVVDGALRDPGLERGLQRRYTKRVRLALGRLAWFIHRFTTPAMRWLFSNPRNVCGVEQAMISMLAGDVFDAPGVMRRLSIFKALYFVATLGDLPASVMSYRHRLAQARTDFSGGTTSQDPG
jgi:flavin-dependent dehydrogenase